MSLRGNVPVAVSTAALPVRALGSLVCTTFAVGGGLQVSRGRSHGALLKGKCARFAIVTAVVVLQLDHLASKRVGIAVRVGVGGEPLSIVGEAEVEFLWVCAHVQILINSVQRALDAAGVAGHIIAAVHQVVAHDVDHVHGLEDLRALLLGEGDHVLLAAGNGNGQSLVADGIAHSSEELGVGVDLGDLVGVGNLFVVLAVAAGVLPVDIYSSSVNEDFML